MQIGYCGLDMESLGAGPDAASLDITEYCEGYVSWDLLMVFIQVLHRSCRSCWSTARQTMLYTQHRCLESAIMWNHDPSLPTMGLLLQTMRTLVVVASPSMLMCMLQSVGAG